MSAEFSQDEINQLVKRVCSMSEEDVRQSNDEMFRDLKRKAISGDVAPWVLKVLDCVERISGYSPDPGHKSSN